MTGLSGSAAAALLAEEGPNELPAPSRVSWVRLFLRQLSGPMVWVLAAAATLALVLGERADAFAILGILALNAIVGFLQEGRAEHALAALQTLAAPQARVLRDGRSTRILAREIVRGDMLVLEAGDRVAADARLVEAHDLSTMESALTGESLPVVKGTAQVPSGKALAERSDEVFLGTSVASGTGLGQVTATGPRTELGRTAELVRTAQPGPTPLQKRLAEVTRKLLLLCLGAVALVLVLGVWRHEPLGTLILTSLSLAVAAMPEGLPAIVTVALALGVQRMAKHHALVRRLAAVETLGCATVICTDKTGTLTRGSMSVREIRGVDERRLLHAAAACCDAELGTDLHSGEGDSTEVALLAAAAERGILRADIEASTPRVEEQPFESSRRTMSVLRADGISYVKGALEAVEARCGVSAKGARATADALGAQGFRVLAVAVGKVGMEGPLELLGLLGLSDPPRPEAAAAVARARRAGIRTVMVTGDHLQTALAIAREVGVLRPGDRPEDVVHARVTAAQKLALVRELKQRGEVVAMTGDGVNDAPALREAHVGIAMGLGGTAVAREAADLVLTDDNFATIVEAVRQGRGIYENIRKTLVYLLAGNVAELAVMVIASATGLPLPLEPVQLLWVNLLTDGLPALALVMDPAPADALDHPPRSPGEPMLGRREWSRILFTGALDTAVVLGAFIFGLRRFGLEEGRDLAFTTLVFTELFRSFSARSDRKTFFAVGLASNLPLLGVVFGSAAAQLLLHLFGPTRRLLGVASFSFAEMGLALAAGLIPVSLLEGWKLVRGWRTPHRGRRHTPC